VIRKFLLTTVSFALLVAGACSNASSAGPSSSGSSTASETSAPATAADCAEQNADAFVEAGTLTVGTDNPAFPPYFAGGETDEHPDWKFNDPYTGKGFEDAVAYEVASRLGFTTDQVAWTVAPFNQTYKPGTKDYDFAIEQISFSAKRAEAVDFSESYYDEGQAVVAVKGTPITNATSISDLAQYTLAAPIGTTSLDLIQDTIGTTPASYNTLNDTVQALNAGQVDGMVVDLPTALYMADPFVQQVKNSVVVGQFPPVEGQPEYFGMTFTKGSVLVGCVNQALDEMKGDGTLADTTTTWLSEKTNVGEVPVFSS
jgi:polar amino acid transport system substrate-binding protein